MTVSFHIPPVIQEAIARSGLDPATTFKEAGLVELYRRGQISHGALADALGIARMEADAILRRYDVTDDLLTSDELRDQVDALRGLVAGGA